MHVSSYVKSLRSRCPRQFLKGGKCFLIACFRPVHTPVRSLLNWMRSQSSGMDPLMGQMMPHAISEAQREGNFTDLHTPCFALFPTIKSVFNFFLWPLLIFKDVNLLSVLSCFVCLFSPSHFFPLGLESGSRK